MNVRDPFRFRSLVKKVEKPSSRPTVRAIQVIAFESNRSRMERAFRKTSLPKQGWELTDITQCLYAKMQRAARAELEQRGTLTARQKHANGAEWIFWAEDRDDVDK